MDIEYIILGAICIIAFLIVLFAVVFILTRPIQFEPPERKAGRDGEKYATQIIKECLNPEDYLLTNVFILSEGKMTELDNVVINGNGVYIIEVKNYSGELYGEEDDYEWLKNKVTYYGNIYQKHVKNPIRQVKRQIYLLSTYLKQNGIKIWVEGYVFLVENNSPVTSEYVLHARSDIDRAIHSKANRKISRQDVERIVSLLSMNGFQY